MIAFLLLRIANSHFDLQKKRKFSASAILQLRTKRSQRQKEMDNLRFRSSLKYNSKKRTRIYQIYLTLNKHFYLIYYITKVKIYKEKK